LNNFHEYLIQHSLKSGGTKDHSRRVKIPGTAPYRKACPLHCDRNWPSTIPKNIIVWCLDLPLKLNWKTPPVLLTRSSFSIVLRVWNVAAGPPDDEDEPPKAGVAPSSAICCLNKCGSSVSKKKSGNNLLPTRKQKLIILHVQLIKTLSCEKTLTLYLP